MRTHQIFEPCMDRNGVHQERAGLIQEDIMQNHSYYKHLYSIEVSFLNGLFLSFIADCLFVLDLDFIISFFLAFQVYSTCFNLYL